MRTPAHKPRRDSTESCGPFALLLSLLFAHLGIMPYTSIPPSAIVVLTPPAGATPSVNVAAVWTLAATAGVGWNVGEVPWSYTGTPTNGALTVTWGANTDTYYISAGGVGFLPWRIPRRFPVNTAVTFTLAAGGSGISGSIPSMPAWTE